MDARSVLDVSVHVICSITVSLGMHIVFLRVHLILWPPRCLLCGTWATGLFGTWGHREHGSSRMHVWGVNLKRFVDPIMKVFWALDDQLPFRFLRHGSLVIRCTDC